MGVIRRGRLLILLPYTWHMVQPSMGTDGHSISTKSYQKTSYSGLAEDCHLKVLKMAQTCVSTCSL